MRKFVTGADDKRVEGKTGIKRGLVTAACRSGARRGGRRQRAACGRWGRILAGFGGRRRWLHDKDNLVRDPRQLLENLDDQRMVMLDEPGADELVRDADSQLAVGTGKRLQWLEPRRVFRSINTLTDDVQHLLPDVLPIAGVLRLRPVLMQCDKFAFSHAPTPIPCPEAYDGPSLEPEVFCSAYITTEVLKVNRNPRIIE